MPKEVFAPFRLCVTLFGCRCACDGNDEVQASITQSLGTMTMDQFKGNNPDLVKSVGEEKFKQMWVRRIWVVFVSVKSITLTLADWRLRVIREGDT